MKTKSFLLSAIFFTSVTLQLKAQKDSVLVDSVPLITQKVKIKSNIEVKRNFVKINLTSLLLKTYSLQYERALNRTISFAVAFRTMPSTTIPFKDQILTLVGDDTATRKAIETFQLSNFAFTPEFRFYVGRKGYGQGFYIAPFYRYAKYKTDQLTFTYHNSSNVSSDINLSGELTTNTAGILFGSQWSLGKHIVLDWWILGPHYGKGSGEFIGVGAKPLTQAEQSDLRQELENIDLPLIEKTVIVNANGASLRLDGPWGGVRAGISLGIKF